MESARTPPHSRTMGSRRRIPKTGAEIPFESALALERELQQQLFQSEDAKEGLAAYVDKRKAEFKGIVRPSPASVLLSATVSTAFDKSNHSH